MTEAMLIAQLTRENPMCRVQWWAVRQSGVQSSVASSIRLQHTSLVSSLSLQSIYSHPSNSRRVRWASLKTSSVICYTDKDSAKAGPVLCTKRCCVLGTSWQERPSAKWVKLFLLFPCLISGPQFPMGRLCCLYSLCGDPWVFLFPPSVCLSWGLSLSSVPQASPFLSPSHTMSSAGRTLKQHLFLRHRLNNLLKYNIHSKEYIIPKYIV